MAPRSKANDTPDAPKASKPKAFCRAKGLKNHKASIGGTEYDIRQHEEIDILTEVHFDKLVHPLIQAVQMVEKY